MSIHPQNRVCPHCRFAYRSRQGRCWLCGEPLPPLEEAPLAGAFVLKGAPATAGEGKRGAAIVENPYAAPPSSAVGHSTLTLSTLSLIMTSAAVCVGVIGLAPGLGIPLAIVVALALARTVAISRRQADVHGLTAGRKALAFASSVGIVSVILFAALIAFGAAFFVSCSGALIIGSRNSNGEGYALIVGGIVGALASLALTVVLFRATLPKRRTPPKDL